MSTGSTQERVAALADATAKLLGIDPEQVMVGGLRISLRADDMRALLDLAGAELPNDDGWRTFVQKHESSGPDGAPADGTRVRVVRPVGTPKEHGQLFMVTTAAGKEYAVYGDELVRPGSATA